MEIAKLLAANALPIICVLGATLLLLKGNKEGWGWLIFLAFITAVSGNYLLTSKNIDISHQSGVSTETTPKK